MKILFIQPPQQMERLYYGKKVHKHYSKKAAILPPLGLAYLAAYMRNKGYEVGVIDGHSLNYTKEEMLEKVKGFNPDFLMFGVITASLQLTVDWIKYLKSKIHLKTILGGPHTVTYPKETLEMYESVDYLVIGEAWDTLPELLETLKEKKDLGDVEGLAYRNTEGKIIVTKSRPRRKSWEGIPHPARDLLPNEIYSTVISKRRPVTTMITASGCPYQCSYCSTDKTAIYRNYKDVVDEMEECADKYGVKEILIYDETFTINQERAKEICNEIIKRDLNKKITFSVRTRGDCISKEILELLAKAGCVRVNYGIESADEKILEGLNRFVPKDKIIQAVHWTNEAGMSPFGFFMIGFPGETPETIKKTIKLAKSLPLDYVQFNKLTPLPNTPLYEEIVSHSGKDYWKDYTLGKTTETDEIRIPESNLKGEELDRWLKKAYRGFYLRPGYVLRMLSKVKSFKEFKELASAAMTILNQ
tara:strand:+ start:933 stop:2351 length:1419 start_codon:yes stop_codon:yes gene_type:complete